MSPRVVTHPPDDKSMWRRLVARTHPDAGGDSDLFVWTMATREAICGALGATVPRYEHEDHRSRRREASTSDAERVPFDPSIDFEVLTDRAIAYSEAVDEPYSLLLRSLADCYPATEGPLHAQQRRGATYKQLAAIGHAVGMSKAERTRWYEVARSVPLSQRHAGHILGRLKAKPEAA
jgi:hypothetical protein